MPEPRDESADTLSLLQKQLILAQVQILELEDVRDGLQATIAARAKILTELQTLADRTLRETEEAKAAEAEARREFNALKQESEKLRFDLTTLQSEATMHAQRLQETAAGLTEAKQAVAAKISRIESLDTELRTLKASRSWRWTAPLRSLERLFR